jgi:hypothetical protein
VAPTPDLRDAVLARIAVATADGGSRATAIAGSGRRRDDWRPAPRPAGRPLLRALALALLAVVAIAGAATALGYRLPGLDIVFVPSIPPAGIPLDGRSPSPSAGGNGGAGSPALPAGSHVDPGSPVPPAGGGLDLGSPVPLAVARAGGPRLLLPW